MERGTHGASTLVSFPLTAAVNILYCRKNLCVSYMLPLPDLITYFTRKEKMFLLSLFEDVLLVAMSICGCVDRCNEESQMCRCPGVDSASKHEKKAG